MNDLYTNEFSLLRNHFFPTLKLKAKIMKNSRYVRIYDTPKTPYQRVIESPHVTKEQKEILTEQHLKLDPIELKESVQEKLKGIYSIYKRLKKAQPSYYVA